MPPSESDLLITGCSQLVDSARTCAAPWPGPGRTRHHSRWRAAHPRRPNRRHRHAPPGRAPSRSAPRRKAGSRRPRGASGLRRLAHAPDLSLRAAPPSTNSASPGRPTSRSRARAAESARPFRPCAAHRPKLLKERALQFLREFAAHGTTTLEAKSGYGLDWKNELKILQCSERSASGTAARYPAHISRRARGAAGIPQAPERLRRSACQAAGFPRLHMRALPNFATSSATRGAFTVAQARKMLDAGSASRPGSAHPRRAACATPAPRASRSS